MRIVIDMQGAQTASRFRGIGRYTLGFAQAVVRNRGEHEVILVLSGLFADTVQPIRDQFAGLLPRQNVVVWEGVGPVAAGPEGNDARRDVAELSREHFLMQLAPDVVHICSLFEGYGDDAVSSIGRLSCDAATSVTLHDLIPLMNPEDYFSGKERFRDYYFGKINDLKKASCFLAVSEYSRQEGIQHLALPEDRFFCTYEAIEDRFSPADSSAGGISSEICDRLGMESPYLLYTGGADERKNLPRLLEAYAFLPDAHRARYQLVLAGKIVREEMEILDRTMRELGLEPRRVIFTGYVSDEDLIELYRHCALFVFPSWHEGFGLPALEAMSCGAPVIAANTSSLPEVVGNPAALFDPLDARAISGAMRAALDNPDLCNELRARGLAHARRFSWNETARRAIAAWEDTLARTGRPTPTARQLTPEVVTTIATRTHGFTEGELVRLASSIAHNHLGGRVRMLAVEVRSHHAYSSMQGGIDHAWQNVTDSLRQASLTEWNALSVIWSTQEARYVLPGTAPGRTAELLWGRGDVLLAIGPVATDMRDPRLDAIRQLKSHGVTVMTAVDQEGAVNLAAQPEHLRRRWIHTWSATLYSSFEVRDQLAKLVSVDDRHSDRPVIIDIRKACGDTTEGAETTLRRLLQQAGHRRRQLLVDLSELVQRDARSGIQRVVRNVLIEWLRCPPRDFRVEPVYATVDGPYRYARRFIHGFLDMEGLSPGEDDPVEYSAGDVFFGLDMQPQVAPAHNKTYQAMRACGVQVSFLVHDILCLQMPQYFEVGAADNFERWLNVVASSDGAICVSRTVANELHQWMTVRHPQRIREGFKIEWSHNGADLQTGIPSLGLPEDAKAVLEAIRAHPSFLMVGTIEPRKGHLQVLDAFELLWSSGHHLNLVIVGKLGWMMDELSVRMTRHSERGKRLFWLEGISDEYLELIYAASSCLIAASYGEGFGLPLVEAAQRGLPVIARDIPVFREVGQAGAYYFGVENAAGLAAALQAWHTLRVKGTAPSSAHIPVQTWRDCARSLARQLTAEGL